MKKYLFFLFLMVKVLLDFSMLFEASTIKQYLILMVSNKH